jgi:hypothetical protein
MEIRYTNPTCEGWPPPPVSRLLDGFFLHGLCWYNVWAENGHIKWESGFPEQPGVIWASGTVEGAWMGFQILGATYDYSAVFCTAENLQEALQLFDKSAEVLSITKALRPA